MRWRKRGSK